MNNPHVLDAKKRPSNRTKNIVGPQIRKLRYARGWSQNRLAMQLQLNGLDMSRDVLAQMESQRHCIRDRHIPCFASALKVELSDLFVGLKEENAVPAFCLKVVMKSSQPR